MFVYYVRIDKIKHFLAFLGSGNLYGICRIADIPLPDYFADSSDH